MKNLEHLSKDLVINELKNNPQESVPQFVQYLNTKYNINEHYSYVYSIIKKNNLWNYIKKSKEHNTLNRLLENQDLITVVKKYSGNNIQIKDLIDIVKTEINMKISSYALKRLINYFRLDYITDKHMYYKTNNELTNKQKKHLINYCNKHNININNLKYQDIKLLYTVFEYEYLYNLMFSLFTNKINNKNNNK